MKRTNLINGLWLQLPHQRKPATMIAKADNITFGFCRVCKKTYKASFTKRHCSQVFCLFVSPTFVRTWPRTFDCNVDQRRSQNALLCGFVFFYIYKGDVVLLVIVAVTSKKKKMASTPIRLVWNKFDDVVTKACRLFLSFTGDVTRHRCAAPPRHVWGLPSLRWQNHRLSASCK